MNKTVRFLQETEVFKGLNEVDLHEVSRLFKRLSLREGEQVVYLGDDSDSVFLIERGQCKVSIPFDFNMGENILSYLYEGDLFGEMGVITRKNRVANITCFTDVELLVMSGADFWKVAEKYTVVLKNIIFTLSERLVALNEGRRAQKRTSLNLNGKQKAALDYFYRFIENRNQSLIDLIMNARAPQRKFRWSPLQPVRRLAYVILRFLVNLVTSPYISKIRDVENVTKGTPAIFLLSFRTYFDFLFFLKAHRQLDAGRKLSFAFRTRSMGRISFFFLRCLFSVLQFSYLGRQHGNPLKGAEDPVNFLLQPRFSGKTVDVALHPFPKRSMRYDRMMGYDHFNIWLKTAEERDIIPVVIRGTDKFWPFEPWNRKFFDISAFFTLKSVEIQFGKRISLKEMKFKEKFDECRGDKKKIRLLFDKTNSAIGNRIAELDGHQYTPLSETAELEILRAFNEKWSNRLSLMLPSGLGLRKKYRKTSVRIRHFTWHAEMLNVLLEHLEEEKYLLPDWAKGILVAGASFPDLDWPFFSMDHSYNPYNKKGMKLFIRFPDLMSLIKKETDSLFRFLEKGYSIEKVLTKMGRIYHFMSDLAVPAHVHNIPHMFIDFPKIGKCDFEEYLGLDQQLLTLHNHEIGDISAVRVESFEDFYRSLNDMARFTFLNSSFNSRQLESIARDRMITSFYGRDDLIKRMKKMGVTVLPVEGFKDEERFYVRNLTSHECDEISKKTTLYSLKTVAACFLFLISMLNEKLIAAGQQTLPWK